MSVAVCHDAWTKTACLYCTTTDQAFGPIFTGTSAGDNAHEFLTWLYENGPLLDLEGIRRHELVGDGRDPRDWHDTSLTLIVQHFMDTVAENEGDGREPDGSRVEGHRIVPTDR